MKAIIPNKRALGVGTMEGLNEHGRPLRVLVVDDEIIVRKLVSQILKSVGYDIIGDAINGRAAVAAYKALKPDFVILDVKMPVMDGLAALKEILTVDPDAQVVMLTSETEKELATEIIKAGVKDYIVKPVERRTMLEALRKARGFNV